MERLEVTRGGQRADVWASVKTRSLLLGKLGICPERVTVRSAAKSTWTHSMASGSFWSKPTPSRSLRYKGFLQSRRPGDPQGAATMVCLLSMQHLGQPYVWGATGPNAFDCSGLICYVYATDRGLSSAGDVSPRSAVEGPAPSPALAPGDLIFFRHNAHVGCTSVAGG